MVGARGKGEGEEGKKKKWKNNIKTFRLEKVGRMLFRIVLFRTYTRPFPEEEMERKSSGLDTKKSWMKSREVFI